MTKPSRTALSRATENLGKRADLELLLTAIRDEDEERALAAYATWRERYPVDDMDVHAMKLVPRLVLRLHALGIEDAETRRLEGIGRYLLLQGHLMLDQARAAAILLVKKARIETVAIKGVLMRERGLVSAYERPMVDADLVLVRPTEYVEAAAVLKRAGWKQGPVLEHATTYTKGRAELDLHRYAVRQDKRFELGPLAWAKPDDGTVPYFLIEATRALIMTCLAGLRTDGGALWVFDAEALVKAGVGWGFVVEHAKARQLVLTLATALKRVRGVPPEVLAALEQAPASHIEALELRHETTKFDRIGDRASRLLGRLRDRSDVVDVRVHEEEPGLRWDRRWEKEWQ